jgi:hypothetical protein
MFHPNTAVSAATRFAGDRLGRLAVLVAALAALVLLPALAPSAAHADTPTEQCTFVPWRMCFPDGGAPLERSRDSEVGHGKRIETTATLFRNGQFVADVFGHNNNWFAGLRPRTLVVAVDNRGRSIWVSDVLASQTLCSVWDACASNRRETFLNSFPEAVGHHAADLRIYHADEANYVDLRNRLIDFIKSAGDIAQAVKAELDKLQKT